MQSGIQGKRAGSRNPLRSKARTEPDQEVKVFLAFGLAIMSCVPRRIISGAHLNPAATLGMAVNCQISILRAVLYTMVFGCLLGKYKIYGFLFPLPQQLNKVTASQGFGIEFLATFQLVLCVLATTDKRRRDVTGSAILAVGLSVGLGHLTATSSTGCGINPTHSFGPAVIKASFQNHWVYWLEPLIGAVAAVLDYDFLLSPKYGDYSNPRDLLGKQWFYWGNSQAHGTKQVAASMTGVGKDEQGGI
uniref:Aquaporin 1 (Colton blood group) n=1 Tax=Paramormyrops kingsleyae TaxID=1676925 RepID=A0A3B3RSJ7_9TELE